LTWIANRELGRRLQWIALAMDRMAGIHFDRWMESWPLRKLGGFSFWLTDHPTTLQNDDRLPECPSEGSSCRIATEHGTNRFVLILTKFGINRRVR